VIKTFPKRELIFQGNNRKELKGIKGQKMVREQKRKETKDG
jgi:hypothetical protein